MPLLHYSQEQNKPFRPIRCPWPLRTLKCIITVASIYYTFGRSYSLLQYHLLQLLLHVSMLFGLIATLEIVVTSQTPQTIDPVSSIWSILRDEDYNECRHAELPKTLIISIAITKTENVTHQNTSTHNSKHLPPARPHRPPCHGSLLLPKSYSAQYSHDN